MTPENVKQLIDRLNAMETKIDEIHTRIATTKTFLIGMRAGVIAILTLIATVGTLIYSFASGKLSLADLWRAVL